MINLFEERPLHEEDPVHGRTNRLCSLDKHKLAHQFKKYVGQWIFASRAFTAGRKKYAGHWGQLRYVGCQVLQDIFLVSFSFLS
jgi:hypothetical protein